MIGQGSNSLLIKITMKRVQDVSILLQLRSHNKQDSTVSTEAPHAPTDSASKKDATDLKVSSDDSNRHCGIMSVAGPVVVLPSNNELHGLVGDVVCTSLCGHATKFNMAALHPLGRAMISSHTVAKQISQSTKHALCGIVQDNVG